MTEAERLARGADAFATARELGERLLGATIARLAAATGVSVRGAGGATTSAEARRIHGARYGDASAREAFARLGRFGAQLRRWQSRDAASVCIVAVNTRRFLPQSGKGIRGSLAALAAPLPGAASGGRLAWTIASADAVVVVDPVLNSPLWQQAELGWSEGVFVADMAFLAFAALRTPAGCWAALSLAVRQVYARAAGARRHAIRASFSGAVFAVGCRRLLSRARDVQAVLLTSNSFAVETLRIFLLGFAPCSSVVEVLHGVPTRDYEGYIAAVLHDAGDRSRRHQFVPQVPLVLEAPFDRPHSDSAINTPITAYRARRPELFTDPAGFIERELGAIAGPVRGPSRPVIVAVAGATSHDPDFLASAAFGVEQILVGELISALRESGRPFRVVYTPHPLHGLDVVARHPFFRDLGVVLYPDTIFTWLVADASVSLFSSALFEARYCGLSTFTPLVLEDGLYAPSLLALHAHPPSGSTPLGQAVRSFVATMAATGTDLVSRAVARLETLTPLDPSVGVPLEASR